MSKIDKLTPGQVARFPEFVERWTQVGLSTDPADRPRAEAAIRESYRCAGLELPRSIVWCGSPLSQGLTRAIILDKKLIKGVGDSVWASVRASVWASVRDSVRDSVGDSAWDSVRDSVRASVRDSVRDSVGDSVRDSVGDSVGGQHDAPWLSFYSYFREVCALESQTDKLRGLFELSQSAGWALPHQSICWVSERHNVLARDDRGRLHSISGPACAYPDGWAIYAIHGVRVPSDVVENPESLTKDRILTEPNAEIRRVMIERIGNEKFLSIAGARAIHEDQRGKLFRIELPGDEPMVLVQVVNSTPEPDGHSKLYTLRVPAEIRRASEAIAWTFGLKEKDYAPAEET